MKKQNKMIIIVMVIVLSVVVGYALFNESLNVGGTASTGSSNFNIVFDKINGISEYQSEGATASIVSGGKALSVSVPGLKMPGAYAKIPVIIKNKGDITARLKNIITSGLNDPNIKVSYEGMGENSILNANDKKEMVIKVAWNRQSAKESTSINFMIVMNYEQVTSVMEESGEVPFIREASEVVDKAKVKASGSYAEYNLPGDKTLLGVTSEVIGRVVVNEEGKTQIALHDKANKYCGLKKYYDSGIDVVSYSDKCIPESANNLIKNGYGEYQDTTNFSQFTYDKANGYFTTTGDRLLELKTDDYIEIDPNKSYSQNVDLKNTGTNATYYIGISELDISKLNVYVYNYYYAPNTLTYLTKDLKDGDTVVYLNDIKNFSLNYSGLIFWNYVDETGYKWPELTYSRNGWAGLYTYSNVNKLSNTITLTEPWNHGLFKARTSVSQTRVSNIYNYGLLADKTLTTNFQTLSNNLDGTVSNGEEVRQKFRQGTKYIKFLSLDNYNSIAGTTTYYKNFVFKEDR